MLLLLKVTFVVLKQASSPLISLNVFVTGKSDF